MSIVIEVKSANGEIRLWERWSEVQSGYQPETTEGAKLEVSPEGRIVLVEYYHYTSFAPCGCGDHIEHKTEVSVEDLISAIKQVADKRKIEQLNESIVKREPDHQTVNELHHLILQANKIREFKCGEL